MPDRTPVEPRIELADLVRDLVDPYTVTEAIALRSATPDERPTRRIRVHRASFPGLLDQLRAAVEPSGGVGVARGYESSPGAALDAVDLLIGIVSGSADMLYDAGRIQKVGVKTRLRALVGLEYGDELRRDHVTIVRGWVTQARLVTRWDQPAIRLRGTCSACGARGTVRVKVDPLSAACRECGATWTGDAEMAILGAHIRWCNGETADEAVSEGVAA
jgi:hypothetical protein